MSDKIYIVYCEDEYSAYNEDTSVLEVCAFATKYFTSHADAEVYRDLLNVLESHAYYTETSYKIAEVDCADDICYKAKLEEESEKLRIKREEANKRIAKIQRNDRLMQFAKLKAEFEGGNWLDILVELKGEFGDCND